MHPATAFDATGAAFWTFAAIAFIGVSFAPDKKTGKYTSTEACCFFIGLAFASAAAFCWFRICGWSY